MRVSIHQLPSIESSTDSAPAASWLGVPTEVAAPNPPPYPALLAALFGVCVGIAMLTSSCAGGARDLYIQAPAPWAAKLTTRYEWVCTGSGLRLEPASPSAAPTAPGATGVDNSGCQAYVAAAESSARGLVAAAESGAEAAAADKPTTVTGSY